MTLYERIEEATKTDATSEQIAGVFGISKNLVNKVREVAHNLEQVEHPERFDEDGLRKDNK